LTARDEARYWLRIAIFLPTAPKFNAPSKGFPSEYFRDGWTGKTTMVWLPTVKKKLKTCFFRFARMYEGDRWTDRQTPRDGIGRAYA